MFFQYFATQHHIHIHLCISHNSSSGSGCSSLIHLHATFFFVLLIINFFWISWWTQTKSISSDVNNNLYMWVCGCVCVERGQGLEEIAGKPPICFILFLAKTCRRKKYYYFLLCCHTYLVETKQILRYIDLYQFPQKKKIVHATCII